MREVQDLMMKRFKVIRILRLEEAKKTKGFFRVEKLLALWNSDHAALTLPKICFLGNFSEYPLSLAKGHRFTIVESWEETFPENLTFGQITWKLLGFTIVQKRRHFHGKLDLFRLEVTSSSQIGGQSKTIYIRGQKRTNSHSLFISTAQWAVL